MKYKNCQSVVTPQIVYTIYNAFKQELDNITLFKGSNPDSFKQTVAYFFENAYIKLNHELIAFNKVTEGSRLLITELAHLRTARNIAGPLIVSDFDFLFDEFERYANGNDFALNDFYNESLLESNTRFLTNMAYFCLLYDTNPAIITAGLAPVNMVRYENDINRKFRAHLLHPKASLVFGGVLMDKRSPNSDDSDRDKELRDKTQRMEEWLVNYITTQHSPPFEFADMGAESKMPFNEFCNEYGLISAAKPPTD